MLRGYVIETRDLNGNRETVEFANRSQFLKWCNGVLEDGMDDEIEIMLVIRLFGPPEPFPCVLYSGLGDPAGLDWDDLIGFLS